MRSLAALALLSIHPACAADAFLDRWESVHAKQPAALRFEISTDKIGYFAGELIPLRLSFSSSERNSYQADTRLQDRVGRMNGMEEFLIDASQFVDDPLHGLPGEAAGMGGLSGGPVTLSDQPFVVERLLNEWVRFQKPGTYRLAVLSRRVSAVNAAQNRLELISNTLTIRIVAAPATWVREQVAAAVKVFDEPADPSELSRQRRLRAGQTLRFLESPNAARELALHMGAGDDVDSWSLHAGVLGSPYRKQLLPLLEARVVAPDQPVWNRYLDTVSRLSELVEGTSKRKQYVDRLIAALPGKEPDALIVSMNTLLEVARRDGAATPWLPAVAASIVADFRSLPAQMQANLLVSRWDVIGSPGMLPVLREIAANPAAQAGARNIALQRILELSPDEGRRIILSEIAQPSATLYPPVLEMLPDRTLPELNENLAARLEAGEHVDWLILRYASGDIVDRVERAYVKRNADYERQKLPVCGSPLVFYFLHYDPAFGERELRQDIDRTGTRTGCDNIGFLFQSLDRNTYTPAIEKIAIDLLTSPKVPIKLAAAELLGKHGSAAAEKPLWDTLEYFHSWWRGREQELEGPTGRESLYFERTLRLALAQADGWKLDQAGLRRLLDLCTSNWCKQEVNGWLDSR